MPGLALFVRARATARGSRRLRLRVDPMVALWPCMLAAAAAAAWAAAMLPTWSTEHYQEALASQTRAEVVDVIAEQEWATLKVELPNGSYTLLPVEPGQEFKDTVPVHNNGDEWVAGTPNDDHGFAIALGIAVFLAALMVPAFTGWFAIEELLSPRSKRRSRPTYYD